MKYQIKITERLQKIVIVEDDSAKGAVDYVKQAWLSGRIVLDNSNFAGEDFAVVGIGDYSIVDKKGNLK